MHLLLIEDDPGLRNALARSLSKAGMRVDTCADGVQALGAWKSLKPDAVVLDLNLPGMDGLDVLRAGREAGLTTPVVILTARGTVGDKVFGLNAGADDYLPKPFDLDELEARLRALYRRSQPLERAAKEDSLKLGPLQYDWESGAMLLRQQIMDLSPRETALLRAVLGKPGHAVSKEKLFEVVFPGELDVQYEAIEVVVYRLRKKLAGSGISLMTLRGLGYLLKEET
jgi:two-component system response regulator TctD